MKEVSPKSPQQALQSSCELLRLDIGELTELDSSYKIFQKLS